MLDTVKVVPPSDDQLEKSTLASMMLCQKKARVMASMLTEDHFYRTRHKVIFRAILECVERGHHADIILVGSILRASGKLEEAGGMKELMWLQEITPTAALGEWYAEQLSEFLARRRLLDMGTETARKALRPGALASEVSAEAEAALTAAAAAKGAARPLQTQSDLVAESYRWIEEAKKRGGHLGVSTGYQSIDHLTGGLEPSFHYVLAARPGMGKTSLAMDIAVAVARAAKRVLFFSAEMSARDIVLRRIATEGRIASSDVRAGRIKDADWGPLSTSAAGLTSLPICYEDTPNIQIDALEQKAMRWGSRGQPGLIVVDYLQLLRAKAESRQEEVSVISRRLKGVARSLSVPVLTLSQLNRGLESREDKRPVLSDLRDSGAIEQDADCVLVIYRDQVYHEHSEDAGTAEIIVRKNRHGALGMRKLAFDAELTSFREIWKK